MEDLLRLVLEVQKISFRGSSFSYFWNYLFLVYSHVYYIKNFKYIIPILNDNKINIHEYNMFFKRHLF